jgi:hypothetical protein
MADQDQSRIFADNKLGNGLDAFSASNTKSKDKSISSSPDALGQLSLEGMTTSLTSYSSDWCTESLVGNPGDAFVRD